MRLLHAKSRRLRSFLDSEVPDYAILSHTWGEGEITFQDIQSLVAPRWKKGWMKLDLACRQALKDHLDWAWIDTCSIDKTSSAELSEAINSMFTWYYESAVCYAFLTDVVLDPRDEPVHEVREAVKQSRWFTRGWTLQELIAPDDVMFFNASWLFLGTRRDLSSTIASTTGIDIGILHADNPYIPGWDTVPRNTNQYRNLKALLQQCSVAERMSWAADRQTTRAEDRAYSLLGLFDINMPLLYGERGKALKRLQEAIIATSPDPTILAWGLTNDECDDGDESDEGTHCLRPVRAHPSRGRKFHKQHAREDDIFASDPSLFRGSTNVVRRSSPTDEIPYLIKDSGVDFRAPVLHLNNEELAVILDCRFRSNYHGHRGPLALNVRRNYCPDGDSGMKAMRCRPSTQCGSRLSYIAGAQVYDATWMEVHLRPAPKLESQNSSRDVSPSNNVSIGAITWIRSLNHPSVAANDIKAVAGAGSEPTIIQFGRFSRRKFYAVRIRTDWARDESSAIAIEQWQPQSNKESPETRALSLEEWKTRSYEQAFPDDSVIIRVTAEAVNQAGADTLALDIEILRPPGWQGWNGYDLDSDAEDENTEIVELIVSEDGDELLYGTGERGGSWWDNEALYDAWARKHNSRRATAISQVSGQVRRVRKSLGLLGEG